MMLWLVISCLLSLFSRCISSSPSEIGMPYELKRSRVMLYSAGKASVSEVSEVMSRVVSVLNDL